MKISNSTQTIVSNISVTESKIQNSDIVDTNDSILGYKVDKVATLRTNSIKLQAYQMITRSTRIL